MPIKSIIIDNKQTTAKRIAPDKVQLDLVALPLDEQNDAEPNLDIRLYVNGQLLKNLQSSADGCIKDMVVIDNVDGEQITIRLENLAQGVKSEIKHIMIQHIQKKEETPIKLDEKFQNLYKLHRDTISDFKMINIYFKELIKPENEHNEQFIRGEFGKIHILAELKYQIKKARELEFYNEYKDKIEKTIAYCKNEMTIYEINNLLRDIQGMVNAHDANIVNIKNQRKQASLEIEKEQKRIKEENEKEQLQKTNEEKNEQLQKTNEEKNEQLQKANEEKQREIDDKNRIRNNKINEIDAQINNKIQERNKVKGQIDRITNSLNRIMEIDGMLPGCDWIIEGEKKYIQKLENSKLLFGHYFNVKNKAKDYQNQLNVLQNRRRYSEKEDRQLTVERDKLSFEGENLLRKICKIQEINHDISRYLYNGDSELFNVEINKFIKVHQSRLDEIELSIKNSNKEKEDIIKDLNGANQSTIENLNKDIQKINERIQNITNKKNAI